MLTGIHQFSSKLPDNFQNSQIFLLFHTYLPYFYFNLSLKCVKIECISEDQKLNGSEKLKKH